MVYKAAVQLERLVKDHGVISKEKIYEEINEIEQRLAEKKFRVAVVGEFNRGKSSLINVLLGSKILPEDVLATTATINRVTYGERPKAYLILNGTSGKTEDIPVEDLVSYVTKLTKSSAQKAAEICEAVVEYPTMLCFNDIDLIDTPGMNDMDDMNAVTVNRLKDIDLAVVAVSALMPFSETERDFVIKLLESSSICQIIFVVTHIDRVRPRERERLIPFLKGRIRTSVLEGLKKSYQPEDKIFQKYDAIFHMPKLYAVSSLEGMEAIETGDMGLYEKSGYLTLTKDLPDIILNSRSIQMIKNAAYRLDRILDEYGDGLRSQQSAYESLETEMEEFFGQISFASEMDSLPHSIAACRKKMMLEKKAIAKNLLLSLSEVRQPSIHAIRDAMLPAMQSEFSRINLMYRVCQSEIVKDIDLCLKCGLRRICDGLKKKFVEKPFLCSAASDILDAFSSTVEQEDFTSDKDDLGHLYFYWAQSPMDIAVNTSPGQSVLSGLESLAGFSLTEGNKQLNAEIQSIYEKKSARAVELSEKLKGDLMSRVDALKGLEKHREPVFRQLHEMKELCGNIYKNYE